MNTISITGFSQVRPRNRKGAAHWTIEDWDALDDMGLKETGDLSPSFDTDEVVASEQWRVRSEPVLIPSYYFPS